MTTATPPGLLRRLGALLYDTLLLVALLFVATALVLPLRSGQAFAPGDPLYTFYLLLVSFIWLGWCWTHGGQTLGMRAWHIRLLSREGNPVSWGSALLRFLAASLSLGLLGLGFWSALWDPERRCWHDRLSGTRMRWDVKRQDRPAN